MRRGCAAGRLLCLSGLMLAGMIAACGCRSTSPLPPSLAANQADTKRTAQPDPKEADDIAWKRAATAPSTASAPEQWANLGRPGGTVNATGFQAEPLPKIEIAPIPEIMVKEPATPPAPRETPAQAASWKRASKHKGDLPLSLPNAPTEMSTVLLPTYTIRPPDVLLIESQKGLLTQPIRGQHLVRPDGTVGLGIYGPAVVAGKTVLEAREEIARVINAKIPKIDYKDIVDNLNVDILAYNSSVYYIITDGAGLGEAVYRFPVTGHETVLDAIANINGLPVVSSTKRIWVARRNYGPVVHETVLPVDWLAITRSGSMTTNWQIMPGDRVFVSADPMRRFNNTLGKFLEPIERVLGATLLGANAYNTIKFGPLAVQ
jgi:polysaccharide biosynthesis/export protein